MARCRSIVLVLVSRPWRKSQGNSRAISAGLLRLSSNRARSSPIRNPADTPKTRHGRACAIARGSKRQANSKWLVHILYTFRAQLTIGIAKASFIDSSNLVTQDVAILVQTAFAFRDKYPNGRRFADVLGACYCR